MFIFTTHSFLSFYRSEANVTKRTLSLAAFEYTVTSTNKPSDADYKELISITDSVFRDMYLSFFTSIPNVAFGSSEITTYTALEPYLVQFDVNLYFEGAATVPDLGQLEEVARQELAQGASYNDIYLQRMKTLASNIFSTTTSVIYISEKADLTAAMKINGTVTVTPGSTSQSVSTGGSTDNNNSVTKIVSPIAAFAGLLLLGGLLANRFKRNRAEPTMDKNVNLMKHVRDGDDVESGTVSGNTYRTGAFTDDGTLGSIGAFEDFRRQKTSKKLQKELEKVMDDLEEVSLGDDCGSTSSGNSDGTMVAYPKSVMSEALKAKKIKKHDESVKPDWASRSASKTFESKEEKIVMRSEQDASTPKNKIVPVDDSGVQTHVAQPAAADDSIIADRVAGSETKVISARPRRFKSETRSSSPSDMFSSDQLKVPESSNVVKNYRVSAKNLAFSPGSPPYLPELNAVESTRTVLAMPELKFKDTSINCTLPGAYFPAAIANKDLTLAATTGKADYASPATERVTDTHSFITPNYSDSPVTYNVHQMPAFTAEIPEASSSKAEKDAIHVVTEASDFPEAVSEDSAKASINAETHVSESTTEAETETPTPSIKAETDALENPIEATVVVPKDSTVAAYVPDAPMEAESTTPRAKNDRKYSLQQSPPMPIADSATSLQTTKQVDKDVEKSTMSTTRLRHVSPNAKSDNPEPEWMQKFKQMGLDKAE